MQTLKQKVPGWKDSAAVYGVVVLIIYAWSIYWFFWKYPSWIQYLKSGEIYAILAYVLTVNFLESLLILLFPLAVSLLLPRAWFHDQFISRACALTLSTLFFFILVANQFDGRTKFNQDLIEMLIIPYTLFTLLFVFAAGRYKWIRTVLEGLADRTLVFLYISIPASIIASVAVILRNLS